MPRLRFLILLTLLAGCGGSAPQVLHARLDLEAGASSAELGALSFHPPLVLGNLTFWPVLSSSVLDVGAFPTLAEAHRAGWAQIRELGSASVSELRVDNQGDTPILACAGTLVKGGKQDRQIGKDVVILPGESQRVPAFCVERGRWTREREGQDTGGRFECLPYLGSKRVRGSASYGDDQSLVWEQVGKVNHKAGERPSTGTFLATVEGGDPGRSRDAIEAALRARLEELSGEHEVVGFAYAIRGEPLTARTFCSEQVFAAQVGPFLKTIALESQLAAGRGKEAYTGEARLDGVLSMIRAIDEGAWTVQSETGGVRRRVKQTRRGGHARTEVRIRLEDGSRGWAVLTEDWTGVVEPDRQLAAELEGLGYLGYTDPE